MGEYIEPFGAYNDGGGDAASNRQANRQDQIRVFSGEKLQLFKKARSGHLFCFQFRLILVQKRAQLEPQGHFDQNIP